MNNYRNSIPIGLLVDVTEAKADDSAQSSVELPPIAIKEGIWTQQINEPITIRATNSYNLPETIERLKRAEAEVVRLQQVEQELSRRLQQSKMIESSDVQSAIDCDSANISLNTTSHLSIDCSNSKRLRMQRMIRLYGDLYSQARVDTLEALDRLDQLRDVSDLKNKLLFSVLVVRNHNCFMFFMTYLI